MPHDAQPALLCITPAPAIDRTAQVDRLEHGRVLRPTELRALPGGKGVNAARAAVRLGGRAITTGIAGGHAGRWIVESLAAEGLEPHWSFARAESRTTYVTVDAAGESVLVYEPPGRASQDEYDAFLRLLEERLLPHCAFAIVAGSLPAGIDAAAHSALVETCRRARRRLLVDASGAYLRAALQAGPDIVKVGRDEAVEAGIVDAGADSTEAATAMHDDGARLAIVTDGAEAVAAAWDGHVAQLSVPRVRVVNAVGSGDTFDAALALALMGGAGVEEALRRGVAAGAANAMTLSAADLDPLMASALEDDVAITTTTR